MFSSHLLITQQMMKSLLKVQNLREKQEVLLPHQSAGGVDLSHGTLTGMANMTRLVVEFVDVCLFCFSIVRMANMARLKWTETILPKHLTT